jgi:hypothetical protein
VSHHSKIASTVKQEMNFAKAMKVTDDVNHSLTLVLTTQTQQDKTKVVTVIVNMKYILPKK